MLAVARLFPLTYRQQNLELAIFFFECGYLPQLVGVAYVYAIERGVHLPKGVVDVGHEPGVGQWIVVIGYIGHNYVLLLSHCSCCREQCECEQ